MKLGTLKHETVPNLADLVDEKNAFLDELEAEENEVNNEAPEVHEKLVPDTNGNEQNDEEEFVNANNSNDIDMQGKFSTKDIKEKKDHSKLKRRAWKFTKSAAALLAGSTAIGILVGSPIFGVVGALAIKYNEPIMKIAKTFGQKTILIPDLSDSKGKGK